MSRQTRLILIILSLTISGGSSSAGYILAGKWPALAVFPTLFMIWLFAKKISVFWSASSVMVIQVIYTAIGIIIDLYLPLMLIAGATALISWELILWHIDSQENLTDPNLSLLEKNHLISLGAASVIGFILMLIGLSLRLQIPFFLNIALVLIAFGGLVTGVQIIAKSRR
jgi:hypothetical protein